MGIVECSPAILEAAGKTLDAEGPVYMVNMVRYRDQADYRGSSVRVSVNPGQRFR
jgi:hypothetical protein